ncbi:hypothetical protein L1887_42371 [Cichorium endivia]|nr:hypothetical protein L1887_42371 [Cichorium endivia]
MEPVGSMSISPANRDVVLAARKGLFIIDLEDPFAPPRFLAHMTTWEAVDIQWSPHPARSNWVASTSNQKLLIWNLDRPGDPRAAAPLTRLLHRGSSTAAPVPSCLPTRISPPNASSAYQSVYNSHSLHSGVTGGTRSGFGASQPAHPMAKHLSQYPRSCSWQVRDLQPSSMSCTHTLEPSPISIGRLSTQRSWPPVPSIPGPGSGSLRMSGGSDAGGRQKPAQGYSAWNAAATQVKFNRASEHRLASTCDNKVLIWDDRKGSLPLATIEAHESKIYGIDWSRDTSLGLDRLVTCSLDRTVKFWNLASDTSQAAIGARELDQTLRLWPVSDEQTRKVGHKPGNPIRVLLTRANAPDISYRDPPLALPVGGEDAAMVASQASGSNITSSSILPPEHATRALLSGKGSGSKIQATSPYSSSMSGFQNIVRDGRTSPLAPFATSVGAARRRSLHHSSSHGDLSTDLNQFSRSPNDTFGRSWGRLDAQQAFTGGSARTQATQMHQLARSLPKHAGEGGGGRFGASYQSSRHGGGSASQHSGGQSSFKVPASLRSKTASNSASASKQRPPNPGRSSGRPLPIQEEQHGAGKKSRRHGDSTQKGDKAARKEERRRLAKAMDPNATKKAVGAAMRLDRGRTAAPAVDPIEWIANVRLEKDETDLDRNASEDHAGDDDGKKQRYDGHVASGLAAGKAVRSAVGFGREGPSTEDDTDGEPGFTVQGLGDEIIGINRKLPRIVFEKVELNKRMCVLTMYGPWADHEPAFLRMRIKFPASYPHRAPQFDLEKSANLSLKTRSYLLRGLTRLSSRAARAGTPCLEVCARFLTGEPIKSLDGTDRAGRGENEEDDAEADPTTSRAEGSAASDTDSDTGILAFRPARTAIGSGAELIKLKMPARRMGASFGPNNELVVFGGSLNQYPQSRDSSRQVSRQGSRSASRAPTDMTAGARSKSKAAMKRSQSKGASRPSTAGTQEGDSDGARGRKGADEGEEESRFLRSYTALSNAMSSLAYYSRTASEGVTTGYSVRDSDVVQLMSTDFFARRLLRKKDFFNIFDSVADADAKSGVATPLARDALVARQKAQTRFYSGSGASTPGARRAGHGDGGGADAAGSDDEQSAAANTLHHADLLGSLPAPAALLVLDRLKETQRRRKMGLVTIYQLVETDADAQD